MSGIEMLQDFSQSESDQRRWSNGQSRPCANYCTYTMMDLKTKAIVAIEVIYKRESNLKSSLLEASGFKRALTELRNAGIEIVECSVTDAQPQFTSKMKRENYQEIRHSREMWRDAKNVDNKICAVCV